MPQKRYRPEEIIAKLRDRSSQRHRSQEFRPECRAYLPALRCST